MYPKIYEAIHKELDILDQRYGNGTAISTSDLDMIDKMFHALKCLKTYEAMEEYGDRGYRRYDSREYRRY